MPLPTPDIVITIHGVGQHSPEEVKMQLQQVWGPSTPPFEVIDFNWCDEVESHYKNIFQRQNRIPELSFSIAKAKGYTPIQNAFLKVCVDLNDFCWGITFLALAVCPLLLVPLAVADHNLLDFSISGSGWLASMCESLKWLVLASIVSSFVLLILSGVFAPVKQGRRLSWWLVRVAILTVIRPVLTLLFWLVPLSGVILTTLGRAVLWFIGLCTASYFLGYILNCWLYSNAQLDYYVLNSLFYIFLFNSVFLVTGDLILDQMLLKGYDLALKDCRDVFNYLGGTSTRTWIHELLDNKLNEIVKSLPKFAFGIPFNIVFPRLDLRSGSIDRLYYGKSGGFFGGNDRSCDAKH